MTLYEALKDINKGRFVDTGCDFRLVSLARGVYSFELESSEKIYIVVFGTPAENARKLESDFYSMTARHNRRIIKAKYTW